MCPGAPRRQTTLAPEISGRRESRVPLLQSFAHLTNTNTSGPAWARHWPSRPPTIGLCAPPHIGLCATRHWPLRLFILYFGNMGMRSPSASRSRTSFTLERSSGPRDRPVRRNPAEIFRIKNSMHNSQPLEQRKIALQGFYIISIVLSKNSDSRMAKRGHI